MAQIDSAAASVFEYRFSSGDLAGHTVGNIFLAAYELASGSMTDGVIAMSKLLDLKGRVLPVTNEPVDIHYRRPDSQVIEGEINISYSDFGGDTKPNVYLVPEVSITDQVASAIAEADVVIVAPGLLYGSLAPVLMTRGLAEAIEHSSAKLLCVSNVVIQKGTDSQQTVSGYISEIERFLGQKTSIDHVFANNNYDTHGHDVSELIRVVDTDYESHFSLTVGDFRDKAMQDVHDVTNVPRQSVRHDKNAISGAIIEYINEL
jgi:uncharacterized cofD-like protein